MIGHATKEFTKDAPEQKDLAYLLKLFESEYGKNGYQPSSKPKKNIKDSAKWLQFRDGFVAKQSKIECHYCKVQLMSDAPKMPCKLKDHIFKRNNNVPKDKQATIDHVVPLSKGGAEYDETNLVIACHSCNGKKADKTLEEFENKRIEKMEKQ